MKTQYFGVLIQFGVTCTHCKAKRPPEITRVLYLGVDRGTAVEWMKCSNNPTLHALLFYVSDGSCVMNDGWNGSEGYQSHLPDEFTYEIAADAFRRILHAYLTLYTDGRLPTVSIPPLVPHCSHSDSY